MDYFITVYRIIIYHTAAAKVSHYFLLWLHSYVANYLKRQLHYTEPFVLHMKLPLTQLYKLVLVSKYRKTENDTQRGRNRNTCLHHNCVLNWTPLAYRAAYPTETYKLENAIRTFHFLTPHKNKQVLRSTRCIIGLWRVGHW